MTDPKRLLEEGTTLEASLLGSAMDDAPRKGLDRRIQAALGIGGIAITTGTASTTAAAATKAAPYLVSLGIAKWAGWAGIVALGAGAVVGAAAIARHEAGSERSPARARASSWISPRATYETLPAAHGVEGARPSGTAAQAEAQAEGRAQEPSAPASEPEAVARVPVAAAPEAKEAVVAANPSRSPSTSPVEVPAPPAPRLSSELKLMDGANAALDSGDADLALTLLDRHDLEFLHGRLAPEALELRIRAYALRHDDAKVAELGRAFLARYPDSPLVPRVRALTSPVDRR
jgi:hypothetical protein